MLAVSAPIIVANAATPLLGWVDTAILGRSGSVADLGAIGLGALLLSFLYWTFGFLRMSTTGFVAQARGAQDEVELRAAVLRALLLAALLSAILMVLARPAIVMGIDLLAAGPSVAPQATDYALIRRFGAFATLGSFVVHGVLIGLAQSRRLLALQVAMNVVNAGLDLWFTSPALGWGIRGIAWGTVTAEWLAFAAGLWMIREPLGRWTDPPWSRIFELTRLRTALRANADISIRTIFLLLGFALFNREGARLGDVPLAANHVSLQFIAFAAFFLDGYAFALESFIGRAVGAGRLDHARATLRSATPLALGTAAVLATAWLVMAPAIVAFITPSEEVRALVGHDAPLVALYVVVAVWAFQLDGVFIGATRTREMKYAAIVSLATFALAIQIAVPVAANSGLWLAFIGFAATRAVTLAACLPRLQRDLFPPRPSSPGPSRTAGIQKGT